MKVLLTVYALQPPLTGIGWYTHYLVKGLQTHSAIEQLSSLPTQPVEGSSQIEPKNYFCSMLKKIAKNRPRKKGYGTCGFGIKKLVRTFSTLYISSYYYRDYCFQQKAKKFVQARFIYHEPCYILKPYSGLKISTVHDLSHIYYPKCHPKARVKFLLDYLPKSISVADHIITGSQFIRNEIVNYFKVKPEKITVIYHGVSNVFRCRQAIELNPVLKRYGLWKKTYLLSVATLEPRKNLERLLQAFSQLSERTRKQFPLVLVGHKGWGINKLEKLIDKLLRKKELICLGYVSSGDLPFLYAGAYGFVYLSLYEGFGCPLLEALASGLPTLTSNTASMPEVVGDAGLLTNPWDSDAITEKLNQLLMDNILRASLKQKSVKRAAQFSWQNCIDNTVGVYQHVLASSS
jgi:glycosyltransferase involved in cell wall biosynthesis